MKIENPYLSAIGAINPTGKGPKAASGESFSDLLSQAVQAEQAGEEMLGGVSSVLPLGKVEPTPALMHHLNGLLDSLDRYSQALGDPQQSLKDIEPLVSELETKSKGLADWESSGDNELQALAHQVATQAQVEVIKFRRGDYC